MIGSAVKIMKIATEEIEASIPRTFWIEAVTSTAPRKAGADASASDPDPAFYKGS